MRILHTSDWHLGHVLRDQPREHEHAFFLQWLLEEIGRQRIDALLVAGDVFETANPSAMAWEAWFGFLAEVRRRYPALGVVVIAGNHDSAARLAAPRRILQSLGVFVVGELPRDGRGRLRAEQLLTPLRDATGREAALCVAIPFLRQADLTAARRVADSSDGDALVDGMRALHEGIFAAAARRRRPGQALVAMAHCYMVGTRVSELSERKVLGGNQHALPLDLFPPDVTYVALGHLHLAQTVGGREHVRYAGSPLPLSMAERDYRHQVCIVELEGEHLVGVESLAAPRLVEMLRIPERGSAAPEALLAELEALPARPDGSDPLLRPYLEVSVALDRPRPELPQRIEEALRGKHPRLIRLTLETAGDRRSLAEAAPSADLQDLDPEEVFRQRYRRDHPGAPGPELLEAFHSLLDEVAQEG